MSNENKLGNELKSIGWLAVISPHLRVLGPCQQAQPPNPIHKACLWEDE